MAADGAGAGAGVVDDAGADAGADAGVAAGAGAAAAIGTDDAKLNDLADELLAVCMLGRICAQ